MKNILDQHNIEKDQKSIDELCQQITNLLSFIKEEINVSSNKQIILGECDIQKEFHEKIIPLEEEFLNKNKMSENLEEFEKFHEIIIKTYESNMLDQQKSKYKIYKEKSSLLQYLDNQLRIILESSDSLEKNFIMTSKINLSLKNRTEDSLNEIVHIDSFGILKGENYYSPINLFSSSDIELILQQKSKCEFDLCNTLEQLELINTKYINICNQVSILKIENEKWKNKLKNNLQQSESSYSFNSSNKQAFIKEINELHFKLEKYDKETKELKYKMACLEENLLNKSKLYEQSCKSLEEFNEKYFNLSNENKELSNHLSQIKEENMKFKECLENLKQLDKSIQVLVTTCNNSSLFKGSSSSNRTLTDLQVDSYFNKNYLKLCQYFTNISKNIENFEFIKKMVYSAMEFKIISKKVVNKINRTFFLLGNKDDKLQEYYWVEDKSIVEKNYENEYRDLSIDYMREIEDLKGVNNELLEKICQNNKENLLYDFQNSFSLKKKEKKLETHLTQETCETEENFLKKQDSHKDVNEFKPRNSKLVRRRDFVLD
jgi:hypothetical protein